MKSLVTAFKLVFIVSIVLFTACGGGSGGDNTNNNAPSFKVTNIPATMTQNGSIDVAGNGFTSGITVTFKTDFEAITVTPTAISDTKISVKVPLGTTSGKKLKLIFTDTAGKYIETANIYTVNSCLRRPFSDYLNTIWEGSTGSETIKISFMEIITTSGFTDNGYDGRISIINNINNSATNYHMYITPDYKIGDAYPLTIRNYPNEPSELKSYIYSDTDSSVFNSSTLTVKMYLDGVFKNSLYRMSLAKSGMNIYHEPQPIAGKILYFHSSGSYFETTSNADASSYEIVFYGSYFNQVFRSITPTTVEPQVITVTLPLDAPLGDGIRYAVRKNGIDLNSPKNIKIMPSWY